MDDFKIILVKKLISIGIIPIKEKVDKMIEDFEKLPEDKRQEVIENLEIINE